MLKKSSLLLAAMLLTLSGCWKSEKPLISTDANTDFDMSGSWVRDGKYNSSIRYDISLNEDGYWFADYMADVYMAESDDRLLAFMPIKGDWYLAQVMKTNGSVETYGVAQIDRSVDGTVGFIDVYESYCTEEIGASEGVVEDARYDCVFSDIDTLTAIAEAQIDMIEAGEEVAIYASYSRAGEE